MIDSIRQARSRFQLSWFSLHSWCLHGRVISDDVKLLLSFMWSTRWHWSILSRSLALLHLPIYDNSIDFYYLLLERPHHKSLKTLWRVFSLQYSLIRLCSSITIFFLETIHARYKTIPKYSQMTELLLHQARVNYLAAIREGSRLIRVVLITSQLDPRMSFENLPADYNAYSVNYLLCCE